MVGQPDSANTSSKGTSGLAFFLPPASSQSLSVVLLHYGIGCPFLFGCHGINSCFLFLLYRYAPYRFNSPVFFFLSQPSNSCPVTAGMPAYSPSKRGNPPASTTVCPMYYDAHHSDLMASGWLPSSSSSSSTKSPSSPSSWPSSPWLSSSLLVPLPSLSLSLPGS